MKRDDMAKLFDEMPRLDLSDFQYGESTFGYLNKSAKPVIEKARNTILEWFKYYPEERKEEFVSRFRDENHHLSAFYELFTHELLRNLGSKIKFPQAGKFKKNNVPDFLVDDPYGKEFVLEACLVARESDKKKAGGKIRNQVLRLIDNYDSPNFSFRLSEIGYPEKAVSLAKIEASLKEFVDKLDYQEIMKACKEKRDRVIPRLDICEGKWTLRVYPIPRGRVKLDRKQRKGVGILSQGVSWAGDIRMKILDKLKKKSSKYGDIKKPYVIAINLFCDGVDQIEEALFGEEATAPRINYRTKDTELLNFRKNNGFWGPDRKKNKRVSAVLVTSYLGPGYVSNVYAYLYHCPYAAYPLDTTLIKLPQEKWHIEKNGQIIFEHVEGAELSQFVKYPLWEYSQFH